VSSHCFRIWGRFCVTAGDSGRVGWIRLDHGKWGLDQVAQRVSPDEPGTGDFTPSNAHSNWENMFLWCPHAKIQIYEFFFIPKNSLNICCACLYSLLEHFSFLLGWAVFFCRGPGQVFKRWDSDRGQAATGLGEKQEDSGERRKRPTHLCFSWGRVWPREPWVLQAAEDREGPSYSCLCPWACYMPPT
jgi:hypothetical protein